MVFIRCNFTLLFIKDLFSEFSLNEFLMNSYEPLVRFSNRIFRVALLFICQCSSFSFVTLQNPTKFLYHTMTIHFCQALIYITKLFLFNHFLSSRYLLCCLSDECYLIILKFICQQEIVSFFIKYYFL